MVLKGGAGRKFRPAFSFEELYQVYKQFDKEWVKKAEETTGQKDMKGDTFISFIAQRTDLCPHNLINPNSAYWLETMALLDSDMGLTLPGPLDEIPGTFFDALGIVRSARGQVKKEDKA